ncbi:hypothetical protein AB0O34_36230 [Sphaerisporangium sp. NPDC088356]|uniref:hypothetical protein n=1 Tax=Sphaerisporangium sp. NPDC088356 TaxID=3154871 RepID=UPI00343B8873
MSKALFGGLPGRTARPGDAARGDLGGEVAQQGQGALRGLPASGWWTRRRRGSARDSSRRWAGDSGQG